MRLWRGRSRLPAARRPPLAAGERVLAYADPAGPEPVPVTPLVATNLGLWRPGTGSPAGPVRLGWHEIHKVTWSGRELVVVPAGQVARHDGYAVVADLPAAAYLLTDPGDLPYQVRARVTRSVGYTQWYELPGAVGLRVASRRVPGVDGLWWTVRYDVAGAGQDPAVRAATAAVVAAAADAAGAGVR